MRPPPLHRRPLLSLSLLPLLAFLACGPAPEVPDAGGEPDAAGGIVAEADPHAVHAAHVPLPLGVSPAETHAGSVYQLGGEWRDQHDDLRPLSSLAGRPQVLAFAYTHCTFACPRIVARMKQIEGLAGPDVGMVLVSIDPERDTPERLASYAEATHLDPRRWTLLNGTDDQILEFAVLLGIQYQATEGGEFAHTNALILLDEAGVPVYRLDGLEAALDPLLARLAALE